MLLSGNRMTAARAAHKEKKKMKTRNTWAIVCAMAMSFVAGTAQAVDGDWNTLSSGNWGDAGNWTSNPLVPGTTAGDTVQLNYNITGQRTVTINTTNRIVGTLLISDASHGYIVAATGGGTLTFDNNSSGATLNVPYAPGLVNTITAPVILADNLTATVGGALTWSGIISDSGGAKSLTQSGGGTLILSGNNTYSGGFTLSAGDVQVSTVNPYTGFGTGTMTITGGRVRTSSAGSFTTTNNMAWNGNFGVYRGTTGTATWTHNGDITLGANVTVTSANNYWTQIINGAIGEAGGARNLSIAGAGQTWTLNGINTYSGSTTIVGSLTIGGAGQLGSGNYAGAISGGGSFIYSSSADQTLSGVISGAGPLTKDTSSISTLTLSGPNTYTGATTLNRGTLQAGVASVAGVSGAFGKDSAVTLANVAGVALDLNGFNTRVGSLAGGGTTGGIVTNSSVTTAILTEGNLSNASTTFGGIFAGPVGLTKNGTGTFTLTGVNNYSGLTTVSDGSLIVTKPSTMGGLTIVAGKTFLYAPTTAGALNIGGAYTLGSATAMNTVLGGTTSQSAIISSGAASLAGTGVVNIRLIPGFAPATGTHNLITAASGLDGAAYTLGKVFGNTDFTLANFTRSATAISVDVAAATPLSGNVYWKGGLSGNTGVWSATDGSGTSNWQVPDGTAQPLVPGASADLVFSATTTPGTMAGMTLGAC
jgi:fibronectin-binding autotransporter adhesin